MASASSLSRPTPTIFALAAVSAAAAIYLLWQQANKDRTSEQPSVTQSLQRRNAFRHRGSTRRWSTAQDDHTFSTTIRYAIRQLREQLQMRMRYNGLTYRASLDLPTPEIYSSPRFPDEIWSTYRANGQHLTEAQHREELDWYKGFVANFMVDQFPVGYVVDSVDTRSLINGLHDFYVPENVVRDVISEWNSGHISDLFDISVHRLSQLDQLEADLATDEPTHAASEFPVEIVSTQEPDGRETIVDDESEDPLEVTAERGERPQSGNMLNLLYYIGGDQAKRDGYIHRGIECNSCGTCPIPGIRYHCANCFDYDLCELCESQQIHIKTHVFFKIRMPAPSRFDSKHVIPVWYPGKPHAMPSELSKEISAQLMEDTGFDKTEIDALYDQFRCLAGYSWDADPCRLGMAIDRKAFDRYFMPPSLLRSPPPNLIYDRIFAFYDSNNDGLIGFHEFLKGLANLQNKTRESKLRRLFNGYDVNRTGYVGRKDFLRMFRAYYALTRALNREIVANMQDDDDGYDTREMIASSHPISAAFSVHFPVGHLSRGGVGKASGLTGDLIINDGQDVLQEDTKAEGNRELAIGAAAQALEPSPPFRSFRAEPPVDEPLGYSDGDRLTLALISYADDADAAALTGPDPTLQAYGWPPINKVEEEDIINALGRYIPIDEIMDPVDRSRVFFAQSQRLDRDSDARNKTTREHAVHERWRRRQFYTDVEEGATKPPGYAEIDSSDGSEDDEARTAPSIPSVSGSRRPSLRSRSSSKVRFEDNLTDTDYETRSNTSSRSIPVGERWGGYEVVDAEKDVGKEVLYQVVQQGFNELLDPLFKDAENLAMEVESSKKARAKWTREIEEYQESVKAHADKVLEASLRAADMLRTEEMIGLGQTGTYEEASTSTPAGIGRDEGIPFNETSQTQSSRPRSRARSISDMDFVEELMHTVDEVVSPDPTLPQNRPSSPPDLSKPATAAHHPNLEVNEELPSSSTQTTTMQPSIEQLKQWAEHNRLEAAGQLGKIDYEEFCSKMVEQDEVPFQKDAPLRRAVTGKWAPSAGLGKLGFLGTWLEMGTF